MKKEQLNELVEYMKALPAEVPSEEIAQAKLSDLKGESRDLELSDLESFTTPPAKYVGNQVCKSCHSEAYSVWVCSKHARTYVVLGTMMAMKMGEKAKIKACCPPKSAKCLTCHATATTVPKEYRTPGFHIEEGVKCESCHGPGEEHAKKAITKDIKGAMLAGPLMPKEDDCMTCHKPKDSHKMLKKKPFDYATFWKKIVHPIKREKGKVD